MPLSKKSVAKPPSPRETVSSESTPPAGPSAFSGTPKLASGPLGLAMFCGPRSSSSSSLAQAAISEIACPGSV